MSYAFKSNGVWTEITGTFTIGTGAAAITYPGDWPLRASAAEKVRVGIAEITDDAAPPNAKITGYTLVDRAGQPVRIALTSVYTLVEAYDLQWTAVKNLRDAAIHAGAPTPSGVADADTDSRVNISGAVQMAQIALAQQTPFSVPWTMHDNVVVMLDAMEMIAMGVAVGQYVARCHARSQFVRAQLQAARDADGATPADVFAVDLTGAVFDADS